MKNIESVEEFNEVTGSDEPCLVDFWASWCGPCVALAPILEELDKELGDQITICKVDSEALPDLCAEQGIMALPTLVIYRKGEPIDRMAGMAKKEVLRDFITKAIG